LVARELGIKVPDGRCLRFKPKEEQDARLARRLAMRKANSRRNYLKNRDRVLAKGKTAERSAYRRRYLKAHREQIRERRRKRYVENRETILAKQRAARKADPERWKRYYRNAYPAARRYWREMYRKHPERFRAKRLEAYRKNPERFKRAARKWYRENRDEILKRDRQYYQENRAGIIAKQLARDRKRRDREAKEDRFLMLVALKGLIGEVDARET
jgi:hypothetical protein